MKYLIAILATLLLVSCSVKKRTYRDGYYIDWAFQKKSKTDLKKVEPSNKITPVKQEDPIEIVTVERTNDLNTSTSLSTKTTLLMDTCGDVITFRSGDQLMVRVTEITDDKIKYKRCDNLDGPDFVVNKSTVAKVKYANGVEEKIEAPKPDYSKLNDPDQYKYKGPKKLHTKAILALVCLIIGFFLFGLGVVIAYFLADSAIREIDAKSDYYKGRQLAKIVRTICKVLFYITLAILALFLIVLIAGI